MHHAATLSLIKEEISKELPISVEVTKKVLDLPWSNANGAGSMPEMRYKLVKSIETQRSKLVAILFCNPESSLGRDEIVPNIDYFHKRSGKAIDLFCAGFGAYWPPKLHPDKRIYARINHVDWQFSNDAFISLIEELEAESDWNFSGEATLIVVTVRKLDSGEIEISWPTAVVCDLETMIRDEAITSIRSLLESLFRYAKDHLGADTAWGFSDDKGVQLATGYLKEMVIGLLPEQVQKLYRQAKHFAVKDLSRKD